MLTFAFYKAQGSWRDALIRWATGSPYSHVEFVLNGPDKNGDAICISASKRDGNIVRVKLFWMDPNHWDFVTVDGDYDKARKVALAQVGRPYSVLAAVLSVTPLSVKIPWGTFCGDQMGLIAGLDNPHTLNPEEFYQIISDDPKQAKAVP